MIDTTIKIYSSNSQTVNVYDSDTGKTVTQATLTLGYRERNTSTSLVLHGDSAINYGQDILTNLVQLTENFCYNSEPALPVIGQKFYNSDTKTLSIYDGTWNELTVKENTDTLDIVYESEITSNHSIYTLTSELSQLIPLSGNDTPVTVTLSGTDPVADNEAVTKRYVDSILTAPVPYLPRIGFVEMQGPLMVADTLRDGDDDTVINVKYVNDLGTVDTVHHNSTPSQLRVTTYCDKDRKNDDGTADTTPWYTTAWVHGTIADGVNDLIVELPISFIAASTVTTNYKCSATILCTSVDSHVKLSTAFIDGSHIQIKRDGTTGDVKFCCDIYGYRART